MSQSQSRPVPIMKLVLVPATVSLAITLVRLTGELLEWSPSLFGRDAGGGGSLVGISWLIPVFGVYFAVRLTRLGFPPRSVLWTILLAVIGAASGMAIMVPFIGRGATDPLAVLAQLVGAVVGISFQYFGWPELFRTLVAYALAARVPVAAVMLLAIIGRWGTHYDAPPPGESLETGALATWFYIGAVPQLTFWIFFTVAIGCLFGGLTALVVKSERR